MKFSIRDLLLLTVIVAILVAWWVDHQKFANLAQKLKKTEEEHQQLRIQAELSTLELKVQNREFEQFKLRAALEQIKSKTPAANPPQE